jgi:hypothetical protein
VPCIGVDTIVDVHYTPVGRRAATYFGLVRPPPGVPRSAWARIFAPSNDSSRSELRAGLTIGLVMALLFLSDIASNHSVWRMLGVVPLLLFAIPQCVKTGRRLRRCA